MTARPLSPAGEDRLRQAIRAEVAERDFVGRSRFDFGEHSRRRGHGTHASGVIGAAGNHSGGVVALDSGLALWRFDGKEPGR